MAIFTKNSGGWKQLKQRSSLHPGLVFFQSPIILKDYYGNSHEAIAVLVDRDGYVLMLSNGQLMLDLYLADVEENHKVFAARDAALAQ